MTLASSISTLITRGKQEKEKDLKIDFKIMMETCLWGNATDLSLLTSLTHEELQALQSVERGADFVLKDDLELVWNHLNNGKGNGRIDFVLDNVSRRFFTCYLSIAY